MTSSGFSNSPSVAVIGGGPAGLMAAEVLGEAGLEVNLYDAMPSVGRKFLLAGVGGMNITHAEPFASFVERYGARQSQIQPQLEAFGADSLRAWIHGLGVETFVGTSGRVFPKEMKAAPLLRSWLKRLRGIGVQIQVRHRWTGWNEHGELMFATPQGMQARRADAVVLALGGASWPKLGSNGAWVDVLTAHDVELATLQPANCGFELHWSEHFQSRFAGSPVKPVIASLTDLNDELHSQQGEFVVTSGGVEGGLIYGLSRYIRELIAARGAATLTLDLVPGRSLEQLTASLSRPRGKDSLAKHLRKVAGVEGVKAGLLREVTTLEQLANPATVARYLKALPLRLKAPMPLAEAISTAGGVPFEALNEGLMLQKLPGVFCAGEMLDWEAPTGGYLLNACFSSGRAAAKGVIAWLQQQGRLPAQ